MVIKKKNKQKKVTTLGPIYTFKKYHKRIIQRISYRPSRTCLSQLDYGLKATEAGRLTPIQLENVRQIATRRISKKLDRFIVHSKRIWPATKKAKGIRMGKGKGAVHYFYSPTPSGQMLYQLENKYENQARLTLKRMMKRLPITSKIVVNPAVPQEAHNDSVLKLRYWVK
jgi:large subunit ribosomal protein L16